MTTHAPMARVPFAPLDNSRLQHLASAKNRQNGLAAQCSTFNGKSEVSSFSKSLLSPGKRTFEVSAFEDIDSENVDPALLCSPSKKSKSDGLDKPLKPFTFSLAPSKSMLPPPTIPSRLATPARDTMSSPRAPLTAPAGRSPKRKCAGVQKNRRISAPFSRIDPPLSSRNDSGIPFSLDAAISGTFSKPSPNSAGATIQESMPKNWFFDIYEDSPQEEAANLMEHSTLTLDLSSDEESSQSAKDDRGKENVPPEDYDAPAASRAASDPLAAAPARVKKTDIIRRKVETDKMDDGERSPLSDLETVDFIPVGLDKDSEVTVNPAPEGSTSLSTKVDLNNLFATPVQFATNSVDKRSAKTPSPTLYDLPVVTNDGDVKGDIIVWEDSAERTSSPVPTTEASLDQAKTNDAVADENRRPTDEKEL